MHALLIRCGARVVVVGVLLLSLVSWSSPLRAQVIHAILCVPTSYAAGSEDKNLKTSLAGTRAKNVVQQMFADVPREQLHLQILDEENYRSDLLIDAIRQIRPRANDVIFVYCVGHGGFDPNNRYGIVVNNSDERISMRRSDISKEIRRFDVRLGILFTESCAAYHPSHAPDVRRIVGAPRVAQSSAPVRKAMPPVIDALFMKERGFVDIAAAKVGTTASFSLEAGPHFTASFADVVENNKNGRLNWDQVFHLAVARLKAYDTRQIPIVFATPSIVKRNKATMDMSVRAIDGTVRVCEVDDNGNAQTAGFQLDDVIVAIEDDRIATTGQYLLAMDRYGGNPVIRISIRRGEREMTINARP